MSSPRPRLRSIHAALLGALLLPACAGGLSDIHTATRSLDDPLVNAAAFLTTFPAISPAACQPLDLPADVRRWLTVKAPGSPTSAQLVPPDAARIIVDTDIDDTLIPSLWDRGRYARLAPYPGVLDLLLVQGGAPETRALVALTARSGGASTKEHLCTWFKQGLGTDAPCANLGVSTGQGYIDSLGMGLVKAQALLDQRRAHPDGKRVFNGDSGQGDWIAALIGRDLDRTGLLYATIHDVRAWSVDHRDELRDELLASAHLSRIYRDALPRGGDEPSFAYEARIEERMRAIRHTIDAALDGPHGRLDGKLLRERNIFLFRNHAALALDLADAGLIDPRGADHVVRRAATGLCFAPHNDLGFDEGERARLVERLRTRAAQRAAVP